MKQLGRAWKKLLSHSNEELMIDGEYTRKGVEALLERFEELIGEAPDAESCDYEFPWK